MKKHTDPACGMQVEGQNTTGHSEHSGETYYFCSAGCKERFDKAPEQFAGKDRAHK